LLLAPKADGPAMIGRVARRLPRGDQDYLAFSYGIIRAWTLPQEVLLLGGLGTLPLAVLTASTDEELPVLVAGIDRRLNEASVPAQSELKLAVSLLAGLRFPARLVNSVIQESDKMKESSTYQAILDEGRLEEARRILLTLGTDAFGAPDEGTIARIDSASDHERIEQWICRVRSASTWHDLLGNA
jgi:hypothetical protein